MYLRLSQAVEDVLCCVCVCVCVCEECGEGSLLPFCILIKMEHDRKRVPGRAVSNRKVDVDCLQVELVLK